jgi:hypothetical protein
VESVGHGEAIMDMSGELVIIGLDEEDDAPPGVAGPGHPSVLPVSQRLFWESHAEWERGDEVGYAHGAFVLTRKGELVGSLTFTFEGEDALVASGALPFDGDKSFADGVLAVVGGTGAHKGRTGEVHVEAQNPKRYRFNTADG